MISAISVKDRLKNQAVTSGKTFQEALTAYLDPCKEESVSEIATPVGTGRNPEAHRLFV